MIHETTVFALALLRLRGVGRVTTHRLLTHFSTYDTLLRYPREQVLVRLKGIAKAAALVETLFDESAFRPNLDQARTVMHRLQTERQIHVLSGEDPHWPVGLNDLPIAARPVVVYAYPQPRHLVKPKVAILARPPVSAAHLDQIENLADLLISKAIGIYGGIAHGFDVTLHQRMMNRTAGSVMVAGCGMAKVAKSVRPTISQAVRGGHILLSPFDLQHGPFEHDDRERAMLQTAMARAAVFVHPQPDTPEWAALEWAVAADRPTFVLATPETPLPDTIQRLETEEDVARLLALFSPDGGAT